MSSVHKCCYRSYISDVKGQNFVLNIGSYSQINKHSLPVFGCSSNQPFMQLQHFVELQKGN